MNTSARSLANNDMRYRMSGMLFFSAALLLWMLSACSGSSTGTPSPAKIETGTDHWEQVAVRQLDAGGMLIPNVKTRPDGSGDAQIAYFVDSDSTDGHYVLEHLLFDLDTLTAATPVSVVEIDNCRALGFDVTASGQPVLAYQGGTVRECGSEQQSDVMLSMNNGGQWNAYTAGIGYVARNPVFQDGLAGNTVAAIAGPDGGIHFCYQFFYEGCDAMNFNYPDLLYVRKSSANPSAEAAEETVEGNVYNANGTADAQNRVGAHAAIVLDADDTPTVFYYANMSPNSQSADFQGLRVARRLNGTWASTWIETGISVGGISAGLAPDGRLVVAYYVDSEYRDSTGFTHSYCLKAAVSNGDGWDTAFVDEQARCGQYCSLAFDRLGNPAVAYRAMENHSGSTVYEDLRYASMENGAWSYETVAAAGDIGHFNTLWFDADDTAYITSYNADDKTIYLFYR